MSKQRPISIAVFEGDGIGPEIMAPCCKLLHQACSRVNSTLPDQDQLVLEMLPLPAGAACYQTTGDALPEASVEAARRADAILLSAIGDPAVRYPDGTEITAQIDLRFALDLYAGLRPIRSIPGVASPLADPRSADIDFVLVRESIEGLFAPQAPGKMIGDERAEETMVITRQISEKLFDASFALAHQRHRKRAATGNSRPGRITCIDKANVFQAFAFFRKMFYEAADRAAQITAYQGSGTWSVDHAYVDIMSLNLVTQPWDYDVMVTENMFGDILSDLGAALIGGMGYAPSADIGDNHAVFQPCHGTAPDIAGKALANPTAMFLSGAMMLEWLGIRQNRPALIKASDLIVSAVDAAFAGGALVTVELGGQSGLTDVSTAVSEQLDLLDIG